METNNRIKDDLISGGCPDELVTEICSYFNSRKKDGSNNSNEIKNSIIRLAEQDGLHTFKSVIDVLSQADYKGLCIFVDDFQNLETRAWNEHRDAFSTQLAQLHEALRDLFEHNEGISIYLMVLVQGRFWEGGSEENPGFKNLASSEKLMQHWKSSVFELAEFATDGDILILTRKILALYECADIHIPTEVIIRFENPQEIRNALNQEPLVPRRIIETILNIVDKSTTTPWSEVES